MKVGINEKLVSRRLTQQKLVSNGIDTSLDIGGVVQQILELGSTIEARESFLLLQRAGLLGAEELETFAKHGEFGFIIAVVTQIDDPVQKGAIEAVWVYNDHGSLAEGKDAEFARATSMAIFESPEQSDSIQSQMGQSNISSIFKSVNSTQELVSNMIAAQSQSSTIPEKRMNTLLDYIQQFIEFISNLVLSKDEVKTVEAPAVEESPMTKLSKETEQWSNKVVGKEPTEVGRS